MERIQLVGPSICEKYLLEYPDYKFFWRAGFAYRGAERVEDNKQPREEYLYQEGRKRITTFEERMKRRYDWSCVLDIFIDKDKKELTFNGFSVNDME